MRCPELVYPRPLRPLQGRCGRNLEFAFAEFEVELKDWKEFLELSGVLGPFLEFLEF